MEDSSEPGGEEGGGAEGEAAGEGYEPLVLAGGLGEDGQLGFVA